MRPSQMLKILSVPGADAPVRLISTHVSGGEPYKGWLEDPDGVVVGRLVDFRFEFVDFSAPSDAERAVWLRDGPIEAEVPIGAFVSPFDARIAWSHPTFEQADYFRGYAGEDSEAFFTFCTCAPAIQLNLHKHGWSGIALIKVNEVVVQELDLFNMECALPEHAVVRNPGHGEMTVTVAMSGRKNPQSQANQLYLEGIVEFADRLEPPRYQKPPMRNRGSPFAERFRELLAQVPQEGRVLDVGGGKRQIDDPRYINLEYSPLEEPDILGDGTRLPFAANPFYQ